MTAMKAIPKPTPYAGPRFVATPVTFAIGSVVLLAPELGVATNEVTGVVVAWTDVVGFLGITTIVELLDELLGTMFVK